MVGLTAVGIGVGTFCFFWWRSCRNTNQNIDNVSEVNINNNRVDVGPKIEINKPIKTSPNRDFDPAPNIKLAEKPPRGSKEWYDWILENDKAFIKRQDEVLKDDKVRIKKQEKWMRKYCPEVLEDSSDEPDNSRD